MPKTHWLDAACVGASTPERLVVPGIVPLRITATGRHSRQMCRTNAFGFPDKAPKETSVVGGFRTGDIVRAVVPATSKKAGVYVGRIAIRATGSCNLKTGQGTIQGIHYRYCQPLHRGDGYAYQKGAALPPQAYMPGSPRRILMTTIAAPVQALIEEFAKLPGIGPKTAQRLTFFLLRSPEDQAHRLSDAIRRLKDEIISCATCYNITDVDPCAICGNPQRDHGVICVVEEPLDVLAIEKTSTFKGVYHVLNGALSPVEGIGPKDLRIEELLNRVRAGEVREVILATNPNYEGDYTATYVAPLLRTFQVQITRLARGLPLGGDLEYADEGTLAGALEGRRAFEG